MTNTLQRLVLGGNDVRKAANGDTVIDAEVDVLGFWLFNKKTGEADADAIRRCSRNRAVGARNYPEDRVVIGTPTVFDDCFRFPSTAAIRTQISEPTEWTMYAVARSTYATMGSTSNERAQIGGWFGNTTNHGSSMIFQSMTVVRGITYQNAGTPAIATADLTVPASSINKWRIYRMWGAASSMRLKNESGDSVSNEPTATSLPDTKINGVQKFAVGARLESGAPSTYIGHCDIAALLLVETAIGPGSTETAIVTQLRNQLSLTALSELAA